MLELRPTCEHCDVALPPDSEDACICTYECTFCKKCVEEILGNVCPNCTGGFVPRPIRPKAQLKQYPPSGKKVWKPVSVEKQEDYKKRFGHIPPSQR